MDFRLLMNYAILVLILDAPQHVLGVILGGTALMILQHKDLFALVNVVMVSEFFLKVVMTGILTTEKAAIQLA